VITILGDLETTTRRESMSLKCIRLVTMLAGLLLFSSAVHAGEKGLMHCFAFTPLPGATDADWDAFYKATDELPGKIEGLQKVWAGKLRTPQKLNANMDAREYGVCMLMDGPDALKVYDDHPAHAAWVEVYSKVRVPGTTTFDVIGQ
jgi:Stress responsive A/B Barrel Domain